jgi:wyosine [tRNA(Phe)-imidazoG37] synthetase (radical SAM superfamily)
MSRYLFGPVRSRRYGQSLGVDLVRPKTCTLNCRFCQLGPTPATTVERRADVPIAAILDELQHWVAVGGTADWITLGGSGEPTLHPQFGEVLRWVHAHTAIRTLLLSNGTLFDAPDVRRDAACADAVKVSLHAWNQASFERIVRPHPSLRFQAIIDGYRRFRADYTGELNIEVFVVPGENDRPEQMARVAALTATLQPARVALNTAVRPPADAGVRVCPPDTLAELAALFTPPADIPRHAAPAATPCACAVADTRAAIRELVVRHPATPADVAAAFDLTPERALAELRALAAADEIRLWQQGNAWYAGPVAAPSCDAPPQGA